MSALYFLIIGFILTCLHHYKVIPFETEPMAVLAGMLTAFGICLVITGHVGPANDK